MYHGERFNGYTHLVGAIFALAGAGLLIGLATLRADPVRIAGFSTYGATLCLLYVASTLYHSTRGRAKRVFRKLDHCAIYLMIAGTYTPFAILTMDHPWGGTLFACMWGLAVVGIVQELCIAKGARITSLAIYLVMGWFALAALFPLVETLSGNAFAWIAGGGLVYSAGIVFYLFDERFRHWHGIWHLFVMGGSAAHYAAILRFVA